MIVNTNTLLISGDKQAIQLQKEYHQLGHTSFELLTKEELNRLILYLKEEGKQTLPID